MDGLLAIFGFSCALLINSGWNTPISDDALGICAAIYITGSFIIHEINKPSGRWRQ